MRLRTLLWSGCISAALALCAVPASAATASHQCVAAEPTAASYTWNFKGEANSIFRDIQSDAQEASYHADMLQSIARDPQTTWDAHADELEYLKSDINDIGAKLCRLQTIRRVVVPWQRNVIDQIVDDTQLMADNAQDAIVFGNTHRSELWLATYQKNVNNLEDEATALAHSVGNAVQFADASKEYQELRHDVAVRPTE
jgi:hypothetical protein